MAKFSPVAPPEYLRLMKEAGVLGDYHLILAHDVVERRELYEGLFKEDDFIIMDNSLCELGHPVSSEVMLEACKIIRPSTAVLPDHLQQMAATIRHSSNAVHKWMDVGVHEHLKSGGFMIVPQGQTYDEVKECITFFMRRADAGDPIDFWSIPKVISEVHGSRMPIIEFLSDLVSYPCVHLLGFGDDLADDIACAQQGIVMGIDSAVPTRLGMNGTIIRTEITDHIPRGDYWEYAAKKEWVSGLVKYNLDWIREQIDG